MVRLVAWTVELIRVVPVELAWIFPRDWVLPTWELKLVSPLPTLTVRLWLPLTVLLKFTFPPVPSMLIDVSVVRLTGSSRLMLLFVVLMFPGVMLVAASSLI